jgi:hypothetical protein
MTPVTCRCVNNARCLILGQIHTVARALLGYIARIMVTLRRGQRPANMSNTCNLRQSRCGRDYSKKQGRQRSSSIRHLERDQRIFLTLKIATYRSPMPDEYAAADSPDDTAHNPDTLHLPVVIERQVSDKKVVGHAIVVCGLGMDCRLRPGDDHQHVSK